MDYLKVSLTALISAAALFLLTKLMGHKQLAQMDVFDYVNGITIGSVAAELATELENPLKPFIALVIYALVAVGLSFLSMKAPGARKLIVGEPVVLMNGDRLFKRNFRRAKLDINEFLSMCRVQGYFSLDGIQTAVFEHNGSLSILPKSGNRPVTPADMKLYPPQEFCTTDIVMDGKIVSGSLEKIGKDVKWLKASLKEKGFDSINEVFAAQTDNKLNLYAYKGE